jgi:hypothetical protein
MSDDLVTIASFPSSPLAYIVKGLLEAEGIDCYIANDAMFDTHPGCVWADGGVHVRVRESDVARARAAIEEAEAQLETPLETPAEDD